MVKIRLTRGGAKKRPHYRIIAIDHHDRREGRPLELKSERIEAWLAKGAKMSPSVASLIKRQRKRAAAGAA